MPEQSTKPPTKSPTIIQNQQAHIVSLIEMRDIYPEGKDHWNILINHIKGMQRLQQKQSSLKTITS